MALEAYEDAIRAWVKTATGFGDERVYFRDQPVERPAQTYVTIKLLDPVPQGTVDGVREIYDAGRPAAEAIEVRVEGYRSVGASIQVWKGGTTGAGSALALATRLQLALRLPSINDALNNAGLGISDAGTVRDLSGVLGTEFEGRAQFDVTFNALETISEFTTFIESGEVTDRETGDTYPLVDL